MTVPYLLTFGCHFELHYHNIPLRDETDKIKHIQSSLLPIQWPHFLSQLITMLRGRIFLLNSTAAKRKMIRQHNGFIRRNHLISYVLTKLLVHPVYPNQHANRLPRSPFPSLNTERCAIQFSSNQFEVKFSSRRGKILSLSQLSLSRRATTCILHKR